VTRPRGARSSDSDRPHPRKTRGYRAASSRSSSVYALARPPTDGSRA
jgi:hypothetical protein